jgi:hypothetical protein
MLSLSGIIPVVWSEATKKWVCNDSRNTTIFAKIPENNYMFQPLIEWAIIRLKTRKIPENHATYHVTYITFGRGENEISFFTMLWGVCGYVEVTWTPMLFAASVVVSSVGMTTCV